MAARSWVSSPGGSEPKASLQKDCRFGKSSSSSGPGPSESSSAEPSGGCCWGCGTPPGLVGAAAPA
eukprot:8150445-Pyramimonas_sp.AAC.1